MFYWFFSSLSHKNSVSLVGGGTREDLCHAWPHHAREWHQGSDHAVWPRWPRAGSHHRLGQTHPRYETDLLSSWFPILFLGAKGRQVLKKQISRVYLRSLHWTERGTQQRGDLGQSWAIAQSNNIHTYAHWDTHTSGAHTLNYWWP